MNKKTAALLILLSLILSFSRAEIPTTAQDADTTKRVSVASDGTQGNERSIWPSISTDGRYIAFWSRASNLVSGDTNATEDVFVHDCQTGQTARVSVASDGTQGNGSSKGPSISADGRYVAFESAASNLVSGDTNVAEDVFVYDRHTGQTTRVSVASNKTQGNGTSKGPSISADGRYVAFWSKASNLVQGDTNETYDTFVHDRQTGQTTRVSVASDGTQGNEASEMPSISADGRYVAFHSYASNLVSGDTNGKADVFVRDRQTNRTIRVSVASNGTQGIIYSYRPSISSDGRYVAFESAASNLVSGDTNEAFDIFVHDRQTGQTTRVSVASNGTQGIMASTYSSISANGRYVAFQSWSPNLVSEDTNRTVDIFVRDRQTGRTTRVSVASDGTQGNDWSEQPSISSDGHFIAFESHANNLVSEDTNGTYDIFVHANDTSVVLCTVSGVPLFKQNIPPVDGIDPPWEDDPYGENGQHKTVGKLGCAMTSAAMLLSQQGIQVDPGQLNEWLKSQTDGYKGPSINWVAVARYARDNDVQLYYHGAVSRSPNGDDILNDSLCQLNMPVVLDVSGFGGTQSHFVLATGQAEINGEQTWTINDPSRDRTNLLDYENDYDSLRLFSPNAEGATLCGGSSSIEILVTDPLGRQTGFDPQTGFQLQEIPNSHYLIESIANDIDPEGEPTPGEKIIEIIGPLAGTYTIQIIGVENSPYTFHFFGYDERQNLAGGKTISGNAVPEAVRTYRVNYSSEIGAPFDVELAAPVLIGPVTNSLTNDNTPIFSWEVVGYNDNYQIQIDTDPTFQDPEQDTTVNQTSYVPTTLADGTTYYWHVRALNTIGEPSPWSEVWIVSIDTLRPTIPTLNLPKDHTNTRDTTPLFRWSVVRGAIQYQLQVTGDPSFTVMTLIDVTTTRPSYTVLDTEKLDYGVYYWRVMAGNAADQWSNWSTVRHFTVTILNQPRNASHITTATPRFIWSRVLGASQYKLEVDDAPDFNTPVFTYTGPATNVVSDPLGYGQHWWRVQVETTEGWSGWTPAWTITVTPPPPGRVPLSAPANRAILDTPAPTFEWGEVTDGHRYQIQIDNQVSFTSPEQDVTLPASLRAYTPTTPLAEGGRYFWRVRAINNVGVAGAWSVPWTFTLTQLPRPTLQTPANRSTTGDNTPDFVWLEVSSGAGSYQLQVDNDRLFGSPEINTPVNDLKFTAVSTLPDGLTYWRVRALSPAGIPGLWSTTWVFTVDTTGPAQPALRLPAGRDGTTDFTPRLVWTRPAGAVEYQVQLATDPDFLDTPIDVYIPVSTYTIPDDHALTYGVYYWQVKARDTVGNWGTWSPVSRFAVTIQRAPKDGSSTTNTRPVFTWARVSDAVAYEFELDDDPAFGSVDETASGPALSFRPLTPLDYDRYYWHVRVDMGTGSGFGDWMPAWEVTITSIPPGRVRTVDLANGTLTNDNTPTFTWLAATSGEHYQIQIDDTADFSSPVQDVTLDAVLAYTADNLDDGRYYWHVRALNDVEAPGPWSVRWLFTVDTEPPAIPELVTPVEGAFVTNPRLRLEWTRVTGAVRYEIQLDPDSLFPLPPIDTGPQWTHRPPTPLSRHDYYWRVRAVDKAGNVSEWSDMRYFELVAGITALPTPNETIPVPAETSEPMPSVVQSDSPWVQQTGVWTAHETPSASGDSYLYSSGQGSGDTLSLTFEGVSITVIYVVNPALGTLGIELDGVLIQSIDCHRVTQTAYVVRTVASALPAGPHTLRIYPIAGTVAVDAFVIK